MIEGYLYAKSEEEVKKDIKKGLTISKGIDLNSLMDTIIVNEINTNNDANLTLSLLKKEIMLLLGKIELPKVKE